MNVLSARSCSVVLFVAIALTVRATADEEKKNQIEKRLDECNVSLEASGLPLDMVLMVFAEEAEIPLLLDPSAVATRNEDELNVSLKIEDVRLRDALDLVTMLTDLSWKYSCGAVVISTNEFLDRFPEEPIGAPEGADEETKQLYSTLSEHRMRVLDLEKDPLQDVVEYFAMNYDLDIVVGRLVYEIPPERRKVSLHMQNLTVAEALTLTTALVGATWKVRSGSISIDKAPNPLAGPGECPFCGREGIEEGQESCPSCEHSLPKE